MSIMNQDLSSFYVFEKFIKNYYFCIRILDFESVTPKMILI